MIRKNRDVCLLGMLHRKSVHRSDLHMSRVLNSRSKKKTKNSKLCTPIS